MDQRSARLLLGEATVLSPTEAAALYGGPRSDLVRAWRIAGVIYEDPQGRERVLWRDVIRWSKGELPTGRRSDDNAPQ